MARQTASSRQSCGVRSHRCCLTFIRTCRPASLAGKVRWAGGSCAIDEKALGSNGVSPGVLADACVGASS